MALHDRSPYGKGSTRIRVCEKPRFRRADHGRSRTPSVPPSSAASCNRRITFSGTLGSSANTAPTPLQRSTRSTAHNASAGRDGRRNHTRSVGTPSVARAGGYTCAAGSTTTRGPPAIERATCRASDHVPQPGPRPIHSTQLPATKPPSGSRASRAAIPEGIRVRTQPRVGCSNRRIASASRRIVCRRWWARSPVLCGSCGMSVRDDAITRLYAGRSRRHAGRRRRHTPPVSRSGRSRPGGCTGSRDCRWTMLRFGQKLADEGR